MNNVFTKTRLSFSEHDEIIFYKYFFIYEVTSALIKVDSDIGSFWFESSKSVITNIALLIIFIFLTGILLQYLWLIL